MTAPDSVLLPDGTRLVHIGPHKTATTAIQSALHGARPALRARGVHYAGPDRHAVAAAQAAIETTPPDGRRVRSLGPWRRLVAEVRGARAARVVVSSEWFADAEPEAIRRIVAELGPGPIHVVLAARPLVRLLPSQWQQHVKAGLTTPYERWLESVLKGTGSVPSAFWHRHRHDLLAARWAEVVGRENVTVIVLDERDRGAILRTFEALLGLEAGTLIPEDARANRSLTLPETELLQAFNVAIKPEIEDSNLRLNLGLYGAAAALEAQPPGDAEPGIETPAWAVTRANDFQREIVEGLIESGVRVLGDVNGLLPQPGADAGTPGRTPEDLDAWVTWPRVAAVAGLGVLTAAGLARRGPAAAPTVAAEVLRPLSTDRLRRVLLQRVKNRVKQAIPRRRPARAPGSGAVKAPARSLTKAETTVLARFAEELRLAGLPASLYDGALRDSIADELRRRPGAASDETPSPPIGASLAIGVVRASGLIPGRRRVPPPRARIETLEIAQVPTGTLAIVVARRMAGDVVRRTRAAP